MCYKYLVVDIQFSLVISLRSEKKLADRSVANIQEHSLGFWDNQYPSHHNPITMMHDGANDLLWCTDDDKMHTLQQ